MDHKAYIDAIKRLEPDYSEIVKRLSDPYLARLLHVGMGLCTEAAEFLDQLKRHIFYGKEIDRTNLREELGELNGISQLGSIRLGTGSKIFSRQI